jgi:two-component system sensor histidine kinase AlgZ
MDDLRDAVSAPGGAREAALPGCGSGMMLRALLTVHAVLGGAVLFQLPAGLGPWVARLSQAAAVAVPATLAWLLLVCLARPWLVRWAPLVQVLASAGVGAAVTLLAWIPMTGLGLAGAAELPWLAPAGAGALMAAALHLGEQWRNRARLPAAATARLADLQTRIRPHFLFNTLNTAISLVQVDPHRAEEVLEDLAELFRAALGALDTPTTLGAEVDLGRRYLAIEQLRFPGRLTVDWHLDPAADGAQLPPLVLQPLLENAVRHGVEPTERHCRIEVRTRRRRDRVLISVTNPVPLGAVPRPGHGIGLASVRERVRLMHDLEGDFRSGIIEDGRWRVSLSVPA